MIVSYLGWLALRNINTWGQKGKTNTEDPNSTNWLAVHILNDLNRAVKSGLWSGRAKVFEFGSNVLGGTKYQSRPAAGTRTTLPSILLVLIVEKYLVCVVEIE
jgi:hypothetical protein